MVKSNSIGARVQLILVVSFLTISSFNTPELSTIKKDLTDEYNFLFCLLCEQSE